MRLPCTAAAPGGQAAQDVLLKGVIRTTLRRYAEKIPAPLATAPRPAVLLLDGIGRVGQDCVELAQAVTPDVLRFGQRVAADDPEVLIFLIPYMSGTASSRMPRPDPSPARAAGAQVWQGGGVGKGGRLPTAGLARRGRGRWPQQGCGRRRRSRAGRRVTVCRSGCCGDDRRQPLCGSPGGRNTVFGPKLAVDSPGPHP